MNQFKHEIELRGVKIGFTMNAAAESGSTNLELQELQQDTYEVTAIFSTSSRVEMGGFELDMEFEVADIHGMFKYPGRVEERSRIPFWKMNFETSSTRGDPFVAFFHQNNENRFAFGIKDVMCQYSYFHELSEEKRTVAYKITGPLNQELVGDSYVLHLLVSFARKNYFQVFADYREYIDRDFPFSQLPVPDCAYDPVFCTWTAVHKDVSAEWVEKVAPMAVEMGFKTLLVDDGWMDWPEDRNSYPFLGTWVAHPRKFPDFAGHVKRMQDLGMRYMLWVAPFKMGWHSELADDYRNLGWHRTPHDADRACIYLDPRYPKVADFVSKLLHRLMREYGLDGLKIDFVDGVGEKIEEHMDASIKQYKFGEYFNEFMRGIVQELTQDRPDLLIESRQQYSNLSNRCWTNCFRSPDVPLNFHQNRFNCAHLRMLYPDQAVYFDPALWAYNDTDENIGRHMISSIIAVPMISVEFDRYPASHLDIIKNWIGFYEAHRDTLIKGKFEPRFRLSHLPETWFWGKDETIIGLYDDIALKLEKAEGTVYILNGSTQECVEFVIGEEKGPGKVTSYDRYGNADWEKTIAFPVSRLAVQVGEYLKIER